MHAGFCREPESKRPLGRPRRRWKNGIKINVTEPGWLGVGQD
jgi:hypothetical protein